MSENAKSIVSAAVVLCVTIAAMFGCNIDGDVLTNAVLVIVDVAVVLYACFKPHTLKREDAEGEAEE